MKARFLAASPLPSLTPISGPAARFVALQGEDAPAIYDKLAERDVVTDLRGDVLRIGFGLYQDEADVEALIARCRT